MSSFSYPVINVEATSLKLKELREQRNISVRKLQELFSFQYPQAIYNWENPKDKTLPCLDNLVVLAKLYKVSMDELVVLRIENSDDFSICEANSSYSISEETLIFVKQNASHDIIKAISKYFACNLN